MFQAMKGCKLHAVTGCVGDKGATGYTCTGVGALWVANAGMVQTICIGDHNGLPLYIAID